MSILHKLWYYCPEPLKRKLHGLAKLALSIRAPRSMGVGIISISNPEKSVVALYLFALTFPLLVLASYTILAKFPILGPIVFQNQLVIWFVQYALFLPFFITYLPLLVIPYVGSPPAFQWPLSEPLGALVFFGSLALILYYPIVCYFLWYRYRVAWILSFTVSGFTIGADAYECALGSFPGATVLWIFGAGINLLILHLLWQSKSGFFNRPE